MTVDSARSTNSTGSLSFQQASELNEKKDVLKTEHLKYVEEHPELKHIMSDFLSQVLLMKPQDIRAFAKDHFQAYLPSEAANSPLIICGPSGVGKGTLVKKMFAEFGQQVGLSVSHTTRDPREGEVNGVHYHFTSKDEMQSAIDDGLFIEHANVHGNFYGTSVQAVKDVASKGKVCLLEIDIQGVKAVKQTTLKPRCVYIAPPSYETLEQRLRDRATETPEELEKRLGNAKEEMAWLDQPGNADVKIINDDLDTAYAELKRAILDWYPTVFGVNGGEAKE